jgi:DNA-binding transcriptional regulator LsrR (DeoR family)
MKHPSKLQPAAIPAPDSEKKSSRKTGKRPPKISDTEQSELLHEFLRLWLVTKPDSKLLKEVKNETAIVAKLTNTFARYNTGGSGSKKILQPEIHRIRKLALEKIGVTVLIGEGHDSIFGSFPERVKRLKSDYRLKELFVPPPHTGASSNIHLLYREAALAFKELIERHPERSNPNVSIGGGKTIFQMLYYLEHIDRPFEISALNSATRMADTEVFDSCYLAHAVHRLCHRSTVRVTSLPPLHENSPEDAIGWHRLLLEKNKDIAEQFRLSLDPDIVFVGTGGFSEYSPSISRFYEKVGITYDDLKSYNPIGDVNLCFFDGQGNDVTEDIVARRWGDRPKVPYFTGMADCHPFLLGLSIHRLRALSQTKTVVLVAGGDRRKTNAIKALLKAGVVNSLVTDEGTMNQILFPEMYPQET